MNKFNKLYTELLEAMGRRQFIKTLGKASSIAGISPGSLGKIAMNLATGAGPIDINKIIIDYVKFNFDALEGVNLGANESLNFMRNSLTLMYSFITKNNLPFFTAAKKRDVLSALKEFDPNEIKKWMELDGMTIEEYYESLMEGGADMGAFDEMLGVLFQNNLVSKEAQKVLYNCTGTSWYDYVNTPEAIKMREEKALASQRNFHQYLQRQNAKDINYSRMDKAGGSEDADYAQTFEKFFYKI